MNRRDLEIRREIALAELVLSEIGCPTTCDIIASYIWPKANEIFNSQWPTIKPLALLSKLELATFSVQSKYRTYVLDAQTINAIRYIVSAIRRGHRPYILHGAPEEQMRCEEVIKMLKEEIQRWDETIRSARSST